MGSTCMERPGSYLCNNGERAAAKAMITDGSDFTSRVGTACSSCRQPGHQRRRPGGRGGGRTVGYLAVERLLLAALTSMSLLQCALTAGTAEFHLAATNGGCSALTSLHANVDVVCQYFDKNDQSTAARRSREQGVPSSSSSSDVSQSKANTREPKCSVIGMQWQRLAVGRFYNITDSDKFGIWPGWGTRKSEHVSLLRVRRVRAEDVGTYRCLVQCAEFDKNGQRLVLERAADIALAQPNRHYAIHGIHVADSFCSRSFRDDVCQLECDGERHLYDGFDCSTTFSRCADDDVCKPRFHNGFCDEECNNKECGWDGGDCISSTLKLSEDTVVLFLSRRQTSTSIHVKALGRELTFLLQTLVRVYPADWSGPHNEPQYRDSYYNNLHNGRQQQNANLGRVINEPLDQVLYLRLDNTRCKNNCFKRAEKAAHFIALSLQKGWDPGISITAVTVLKKLGAHEQCTIENSTRMDIDLIAVDRGHQQGSGEGFMSFGLQPWVLVAAVASGLALLLLIITLSLVMCRMLTRRHKRCRRDSFDLYDSTARIRAEKGPPGTDV